MTAEKIKVSVQTSVGAGVPVVDSLSGTGMVFKERPFADGEYAIVVAFDMIASTEVIRKLTVRSAVPRFFDYVTTPLKRYMADKQTKDNLDFGHYKFTGDGWILLFGRKTTGAE